MPGGMTSRTGRWSIGFRFRSTLTSSNRGFGYAGFEMESSFSATPPRSQADFQA